MTPANAIRSFVVAVAVVTSGSSANAQVKDIIVQRGFSELISIPGEINNVAVGDAEIIDAQPLTSNTFLLNAKKQGTTNLIVIDDVGRALFRARVHVRAVDIWPGYPVTVSFGTGLAHSYVCDPQTGCPVRPPRPQPQLPPVLNLNYGPTTINNAAGPAGAPNGQPAAAPQAQ